MQPYHPKAVVLLATLLALFTPLTNATLDPATSNTKGKYPLKPGCAPSKSSPAIQAAECSHNTRTRGQTFAIFTTNHKYDSSHGAPYGTCEAYACSAGAGTSTSTNAETETDGSSSSNGKGETAMGVKDGVWTFYWGDEGEEKGEGAGCIKSPKDGSCGCENSDGKFVAGGSGCK